MVSCGRCPLTAIVGIIEDRDQEIAPKVTEPTVRDREIAPSVPGMGMYSLTERSQPEDVTETVVKRKGQPEGSVEQRGGRRNTNKQ